MRKNYYLVMSLAAVATLSSCKKLGELSADNFTVTPTPLEAIAGQVPATIDGKFPEKYMKKKKSRFLKICICWIMSAFRI